jgi:hypothetical protein
LAPGFAKWSPATAPAAFCSSIIVRNTSLARSTTPLSNADRKTTMPGPSINARASSAARSSRSAVRIRSP